MWYVHTNQWSNRLCKVIGFCRNQIETQYNKATAKCLYVNGAGRQSEVSLNRFGYHLIFGFLSRKEVLSVFCIYIYMWNLCFFHVFPHRSLTMAYQHQPINLIFISNAMTFFLQHPATAAARLLLRPGMLYITYIDAKWFIQLQHSSISTINMSISIGSNKIDSLVAECILCHWSVYVFFFLLFF